MNERMHWLGVGVASIAASVVLAVGVGTATAGRPQGMTQAEYKALMTRSAALNAWYGLGHPAGVADRPQGMTQAEYKALMTRSAALNSWYGLDRPGGAAGRPEGTTGSASAQPAEPTRNGFHWGDFGIGAGGMFGLVLVIVGALARLGRLQPAARTS